MSHGALNICSLALPRSLPTPGLEHVWGDGSPGHYSPAGRGGGGQSRREKRLEAQGEGVFSGGAAGWEAIMFGN